MQVVSLGDSLHEMSKPISWEKKEKYFKMFPAKILTQHMLIVKKQMQKKKAYFGQTKVWNIVFEI